LATDGSGGDADGDSYAGVEGLIGSDQADTLTGDANTNVLHGGDGNDTLAGLGGTDVRRLWSAMQTGARLAMLANPTRDLAAALLEVPGSLLGLTERDAAMLQQGLGENQFPDELAAIRDLEAVRTFAGTIMTMTQTTVMNITNLDRAGFEALMWGGPLPVISPAFRLNAAGTGPATTIEPGVVTGKLPMLKA